MTLAAVAVVTGGVLSLGMAVLHSRLPAILGWEEEFGRLSDSNARALASIHMALTLVFVVLGLVSIACVQEISQGVGLGGWLAGSCGAFWAVAAVWHATVLRPGPDGKGAKLHLVMLLWHGLLALCYLTPILVRATAP